MNSKIAYFFRSLNFSFVDKKADNIFHIVPIGSDEEKFAREKYFMKKDNEEIFVITPPAH